MKNTINQIVCIMADDIDINSLTPYNAFHLGFILCLLEQLLEKADDLEKSNNQRHGA
jgi:hypothetical protein